MLTLEHSRIGAGKAWGAVAGEFQQEWEKSLENLAAVLETGEDLRLTRRPMMGIGVSDFDAEIARQMGVPVSKGIRLDAVVAGMGAEAAGLQPGDVIVRMGGMDTPDGAACTRSCSRTAPAMRWQLISIVGRRKGRPAWCSLADPYRSCPPAWLGVADALRKRSDAGLCGT